jgi:ADP-heptose:LPS heptosyltransferase
MMKEVCLDLSQCRGLGDTICATPVLRKLYNSYGRKIAVITLHPDIFRNNKYVSELYHPDNSDKNVINERYEVLNSFNAPNQTDCRGVVQKHNAIDIRQFHAISLGFMLSDYEMDMDYTPNSYEEIEGLPEKYVLIHPVQTWNSRTWSHEKWKALTQLLNDNGIAVVSTGKDSSEIGNFNVQKPVFNFDIKLGLNLLNKCSISQTWWLVQKSLCMITMDSGLLHLAGTTDANIIQLGSSIKNDLRAPYRHGTQKYKYDYISGPCGIFCGSDPKYGVREWGTIQAVPPLVNCLENKSEFECHPSVIQVFNKVISIVN